MHTTRYYMFPYVGKTRFLSLNLRKSLIFKKMFFFISGLWRLLFTFFVFIDGYFSRIKEMVIPRKVDTDLDMDLIDDEEESESLLKFQFRSFDEFVQSNDNVGFLNDDQVVNDHSNDKENVENSRIQGFVENEADIIAEPRKDDIIEPRKEGLDDNVSEIIIIKSMKDGIIEPKEEGLLENVGETIANSTKDDIVEPKEEGLFENVGEMIAKPGDFINDDESMVSDLDSGRSMVFSSDSSFRSSIIDSISDGYLSDIDFERAFEIDTTVENGYFIDEFELTCEISAEDENEGVSQDRKADLDSITGENDENQENSEKTSPISPDDDQNEGDFEQEWEEHQELDPNLYENVENTTENQENNEKPSSISPDDDQYEGDFEQEWEEHQELDPNLYENVENTTENQENNEKPSSISPDDDQNEADFEQEWEERQELDPNLYENVENKTQENNEKPSSISPDDDQNEVDFEQEWEEHQDLVEQLKMEIKKVRMVEIGLPTILEESESIPKIMDDLKPWKIEGNNKGSNGNAIMDEIHKVYKSYGQRMRKLDILNYQKMYAIGFLKLKDPLGGFITNNKISNRAIASIVSVDCWPCKPKTTSQTQQPALLKKKLNKEIQCDLEMIYVGQMCLSWEFLCWEYGKALELWESDPYEARRYNDVANKFQAFQVLLTRFLEDEAFEGPRVQHYVKTRCLFRNLLQVPVVRDDNYRNRNKERKIISSKEAVTSLQLVQIIEKCIRILWRFIRIDNDTSNVVVVNCRQTVNVELQNPADATLLAKVRSTLDKKERKIRKSENCVRRNLESCQEEEEENGNDKVLYFFSKVDMKLVSRVLNMSRISREQLIWCINKLNNIKFVGNKLHLDSSLLLFP